VTYRVETDRGWVTAERVTQVIRRGMPSPFLERWKLREAVRWALANPPLSVDDDAVAACIAAWESDSRKHSRRGTDVHRLIATWIRDATLDVTVPAEHEGYWAAFHEWLRSEWFAVKSDEVRVEQTLLDGSMTVAGTADLISGGVLVDWKTAATRSDEEAWPDQVAQVGAYASMKYLVTNKKVAGRAPVIREARIVRLCADGSWREHKIAGGDLADAKALWSHVREVARSVKGPDYD
jgi:hypothetical protein